MTSRNNTLLFRKIFSMILILGFVSMPFVQGMHHQEEGTVLSMQETIACSPVELKKGNGNLSVILSEGNAFTMVPGGYKLPVIQKTYEFAIGTRISTVTVIPKDTRTVTVTKPIEKIPAFHEMNGKKTLTLNYEPVIAESSVYPSSDFRYHTGMGLNKDNQRVVFLSVTIYPVHYHPHQGIITSSDEIDLEINYQSPHQKMQVKGNMNEKDLLIITHDSYASSLDQFINHKQQYGFTVHVETLSHIYQTYPGRDNREQIKYAVKDAIEEWGATYVLLLGDIKQLPMRAADAYPWEGYHGSGVLTDLYYADVYDSTGAFCSWDANQNNVFGEVDFEEFPFTMDGDLDDVDLYADVHIGRIPCTTHEELLIILNKIMTYETTTYDQTWFQNILLAGGDTFGLHDGSPINQFEGEITNVKVGQQVPQFNQIRLWASERTLHFWTFNRQISKGVGFVSYAGHGFEHGWGTYHPNAVLEGNLIFYFTPYLRFLKNEHKLPIIFFDACLTAKLDFNITDMIEYFGWKAKVVNFFMGGYTPQDNLDVFAWAFLKMEQGGCVANIGATRPAYTFVDRNGVYAGAGYLDVHFFKAYEEGVTVGEMLTASQRDYAQYVGKDFFTIEEYILLGDPSLRVGGYP